jgi:hypothetical protein
MYCLTWYINWLFAIKINKILWPVEHFSPQYGILSIATYIYNLPRFLCSELHKTESTFFWLKSCQEVFHTPLSMPKNKQAAAKSILWSSKKETSSRTLCSWFAEEARNFIYFCFHWFNKSRRPVVERSL